jgi:hypothetical protein
MATATVHVDRERNARTPPIADSDFGDSTSDKDVSSARECPVTIVLAPSALCSLRRERKPIDLQDNGTLGDWNCGGQNSCVASILSYSVIGDFSVIHVFLVPDVIRTPSRSPVFQRRGSPTKRNAIRQSLASENPLEIQVVRAATWMGSATSVLMTIRKYLSNFPRPWQNSGEENREIFKHRRHCLMGEWMFKQFDRRTRLKVETKDFNSRNRPPDLLSHK